MSGDEITIIIKAPPAVTEITQNHKGYDVLCLTRSCLENLIAPDTYDSHLIITRLPRYSTEVL